MYTTTDRFLSYINRSGPRRFKADLYWGQALLKEDLPIISAQINYDRKSRNRASGSIQFAGFNQDWNLDAFGQEIVLSIGVVYPDGTEELVPMGRFRIEDWSLDEATRQTPTVNFFDRSKMFTDVVTWEDDFSGKLASVVFAGHIEFCMTSSIGSVPSHFDITDFRLPGGSVSSSDDWEFLEQIAKVKGADVWVDRNGEVNIAVIPGITSTTAISDAVFDFSVGINLINAHRQTTREGGYNGVIVYGASGSNGNKVSAYVWDGDGVTSYWGPYGKKIETLNLPQITTQAEATTAAQAELAKTLGLVKGTSFTALLNPALDVGDIVTLFYFDTVEIHQIDSISISLPGWTMDVTTRSIHVGA